MDYHIVSGLKEYSTKVIITLFFTFTVRDRDTKEITPNKYMLKYLIDFF